MKCHRLTPTITIDMIAPSICLLSDDDKKTHSTRDSYSATQSVK